MNSFLVKSVFTTVLAMLLIQSLFVRSLFAQDLVAAKAQQNLTLEQAVALVREQNPQLAARNQQALAMTFRPAQLVSLPDPVLTLGAMNLPADTFSTSSEAMTQMQVSVSQSIPFPGKLRLQGEAETYLARAAEADVAELALQLISRVKQSWWNLFYLDRALEAVAHNQQLMRQLIRVAESKYKVGKGLQQDVLLAQLELSRLLDMKIQLESARQQQGAALNSLLNRPAATPLVLSNNDKDKLPVLPGQAALFKQALKMRPLLLKQQQFIAAARTRSELAARDDYPDFKLGASYGFRQANPVTGVDRADLASLTLSINMPFFTGSKQDAHAGQRQAELAAADFTLQDIQNTVLAGISQLLSSYENSKAQAELFRSGIIPQANQTVASMLAAYQVNKVDFLNLMRAQVTLYNYETQYWKVFAEAKQALAQLDAMVGGDVSYE